MDRNVTSGVVAGETLLARYEEMRQATLEGLGTIGQGAVILLRRGMAAWMRAWSECCHFGAEETEHRRGAGCDVPCAGA